MKIGDILNEINNIIWDDNLSDEKALEKILLILKDYNANNETENDTEQK